VHQALTGLSLSASSVGSRPAVHAPIMHENEQGPGGHRARLRVTRTKAGRLHRGGSEVEESTRRLGGMSLWSVWGCRRRVDEASSTGNDGGRSGGGPAGERISTLLLGEWQRTRTKKRPSQLPHLYLVLHMRWLSASQFSALLYNYLGRSHSFFSLSLLITLFSFLFHFSGRGDGLL